MSLLTENVLMWSRSFLPSDSNDPTEYPTVWLIWRCLEHYHSRLEPQSLPLHFDPQDCIVKGTVLAMWYRISDLLMYFGLAVTVEAWVRLLKPNTEQEGDLATSQLLTVLHQNFTVDNSEVTLRLGDASSSNAAPTPTFCLDDYLQDVGTNAEALAKTVKLCVQLCCNDLASGVSSSQTLSLSNDDSTSSPNQQPHTPLQRNIRRVASHLLDCLPLTNTNRATVFRTFLTFYHELPQGSKAVDALTEWFLDFGGGMDRMLPYLSYRCDGNEVCSTEEVALVSQLVCVVVAPGATLQRKLLEEELLGRLSSDTESYLKVISTLSEHMQLHPSALSCGLTYTLHLLTTRLNPGVFLMAVHIALNLQSQLKEAMWLEMILQHVHRGLQRSDVSAVDIVGLCSSLIAVLGQTNEERVLYPALVSFFGTALRCVFSCSQSRRTTIMMICDVLLRIPDLPLGDFFVQFDECITNNPTLYTQLSLAEITALCSLCKHPRLFCLNAEVEVLLSILTRFMQNNMIYTTTVMVAVCVLSLRLETDPAYLQYLTSVIHEECRYALKNRTMVHLWVRKLYALGSTQLSKVVVDGCSRLNLDCLFEGKKRNIPRFHTSLAYGTYVMDMLNALGIKLVPPEGGGDIGISGVRGHNNGNQGDDLIGQPLPPLKKVAPGAPKPVHKSLLAAGLNHEARQKQLWVRLTIVEGIVDKAFGLISKKEQEQHHMKLLKLAPMQHKLPNFEGPYSKSKAHAQARVTALKDAQNQPPPTVLPTLSDDVLDEPPPVKAPKSKATFDRVGPLMSAPDTLFPFVHIDSKLITATIVGGPPQLAWSADKKGTNLVIAPDSNNRVVGGACQSCIGSMSLKEIMMTTTPPEATTTTPTTTTVGSFSIKLRWEDGQRDFGCGLGAGNYVGISSSGFVEYDARYDVIRDSIDTIWALQDVQDEDIMEHTNVVPALNPLGRVFGHDEVVTVSWDTSTGEVTISRDQTPPTNAQDQTTPA